MRVIQYDTTLGSHGEAYAIRKKIRNWTGHDKKMDSVEKLVEFATGYLHMDDMTEEYVYLCCLNAKSDLIGIFEVSHGAANQSICNAREIFQKALFGNALGIILLHNHPSGDPQPSKSDILSTLKTHQSGQILGVDLIDHIIIGHPRRHCSLRSYKDSAEIWKGEGFCG